MAWGLSRAVYVSTATREMRDEDLLAILDVSRRDNPVRWNATGALAYHDLAFIQVLEGPRPSIEALLAAIRRDGRHAGMTVLDLSPAAGRSFGGWSMGWVTAAGLAREGFDPGVPFLRGTPDALVNAMLAAFRATTRLDRWAHRDPGRGGSR